MNLPPRRIPQEVEDDLARKAEKALAQFRRTTAERDRLADLIPEVASTPDGAVAVRNAMASHREAMERLREALRALRAAEQARDSEP